MLRNRLRLLEGEKSELERNRSALVEQTRALADQVARLEGDLARHRDALVVEAAQHAEHVHLARSKVQARDQQLDSLEEDRETLLQVIEVSGSWESRGKGNWARELPATGVAVGRSLCPAVPCTRLCG